MRLVINFLARCVDKLNQTVCSFFLNFLATITESFINAARNICIMSKDRFKTLFPCFSCWSCCDFYSSVCHGFYKLITVSTKNKQNTFRIVFLFSTNEASNARPTTTWIIVIIVIFFVISRKQKKTCSKTSWVLRLWCCLT